MNENEASEEEETAMKYCKWTGLLSPISRRKVNYQDFENYRRIKLYTL